MESFNLFCRRFNIIQTDSNFEALFLLFKTFCMNPKQEFPYEDDFLPNELMCNYLIGIVNYYNGCKSEAKKFFQATISHPNAFVFLFFIYIEEKNFPMAHYLLKNIPNMFDQHDFIGLWGHYFEAIGQPYNALQCYYTYYKQCCSESTKLDSIFKPFMINNITESILKPQPTYDYIIPAAVRLKTQYYFLDKIYTLCEANSFDVNKIALQSVLKNIQIQFKLIAFTLQTKNTYVYLLELIYNSVYMFNTNSFKPFYEDTIDTVLHEEIKKSSFIFDEHEVQLTNANLPLSDESKKMILDIEGMFKNLEYTNLNLLNKNIQYYYTAYYYGCEVSFLMMASVLALLRDYENALYCCIYQLELTPSKKDYIYDIIFTILINIGDRNLFNYFVPMNKKNLKKHILYYMVNIHDTTKESLDDLCEEAVQDLDENIPIMFKIGSYYMINYYTQKIMTLCDLLYTKGYYDMCFITLSNTYRQQKSMEFNQTLYLKIKETETVVLMLKKSKGYYINFLINTFNIIQNYDPKKHEQVLNETIQFLTRLLTADKNVFKSDHPTNTQLLLYEEKFLKEFKQHIYVLYYILEQLVKNFNINPSILKELSGSSEITIFNNKRNFIKSVNYTLPECPICLTESPNDIIPLTCFHFVCISCYINMTDTKCPLCRHEDKR